jgi:hypothetical protein
MDYVSRGGERLTTAESLIRQLIENSYYKKRNENTSECDIWLLFKYTNVFESLEVNGT